MSTTDPPFSPGAPALGQGAGSFAPAPAAHPGRSRTKRQPSLINLRGSALILDGLILLVPVMAADYLLSRAFPHRGFFWGSGHASSLGAGLGTPGVLMALALSFTYFFLMEATRGQTIGKRHYGLCVESASGGRAGVNAISARTVLRLLDQLPVFYLGGAFIAIATGPRRRRLGDWAAGTVVVRVREEQASAPAPAVPSVFLAAPPQMSPPAPVGAPAPAGVPAHASVSGIATPIDMGPAARGTEAMVGSSNAARSRPDGRRAPAAAPVPRGWLLTAYPLAWVAGVFILTFATGLGRTEGAGEQAVALVRSYVAARQSGDAALACSMLTPGQQRELVAIRSGGNYESANASRCPEYILQTATNTHLLNPELPALAAAPRIAYAAPDLVVIVSPQAPGLELAAVAEGDAMKLDVRGVQRVAFTDVCARTGGATAGECQCAFERLRAEGQIPETSQQIINGSWQKEARTALAECGGQAGAAAG